LLPSLVHSAIMVKQFTDSVWVGGMDYERTVRVADYLIIGLQVHQQAVEKITRDSEAARL